jgi:hypothetical protein
MQSASDHLQAHGYVVLPVLWMDDEKRMATRSILRSMCGGMKEFKSTAKQYVMGGFGALGNPSSFHNEGVRLLRQYAQHEVSPLMACVASDGEKLEQLIDRMMIRKSGKGASPETWHRDEAVNAKPTDRVFGGWWNFDDVDQVFSCVPSTHNDVTGNSGFSIIKGDEEIARLKSISIRVSIPPGHIIVFYERIVHEVVAGVKKIDQYRLFLGWRLTVDDSPLTPIDDILTDQGVVPLKSGQIPPMYASLHWTNWRPLITQFSEGVVDQCLELKVVGSGKDMGEKRIIVHRHMRSLRQYGLQRYHPYTRDERMMHTPNRMWTVRRGDDNKKYEIKLVSEDE